MQGMLGHQGCKVTVRHKQHDSTSSHKLARRCKGLMRAAEPDKQPADAPPSPGRTVLRGPRPCCMCMLSILHESDAMVVLPVLVLACMLLLIVQSSTTQCCHAL